MDSISVGRRSMADATTYESRQVPASALEFLVMILQQASRLHPLLLREQYYDCKIKTRISMPKESELEGWTIEYAARRINEKYNIKGDPAHRIIKGGRWHAEQQIADARQKLEVQKRRNVPNASMVQNLQEIISRQQALIESIKRISKIDWNG